MSNNLGTLNGSLISARALELLFKKFPFLGAITADFSEQQGLLNQPVLISLPAAMSASTYSASGGYAASAVTRSQASLTIDQHVYSRFSFSDTEMSSSPANLVEEFAESCAQSLGQRLMSSLNSLVLAENFTNYSVLAESAVDWAALVQLNSKLSGRSLNQSGRFCVLNSDAYANLLQSPEIVANAASPSDAVKSGKLNMVSGMTVYEWPGLAANSQHLVGFAGTSQGMLLATRPPVVDQRVANATGILEFTREPVTGLTVQTRQWYDYSLGALNYCATVLYGCAVGNSACLERIVSQEPA